MWASLLSECPLGGTTIGVECPAAQVVSLLVARRHGGARACLLTCLVAGDSFPRILGSTGWSDLAWRGYDLANGGEQPEATSALRYSELRHGPVR